MSAQSVPRIWCPNGTNCPGAVLNRGFVPECIVWVEVPESEFQNIGIDLEDGNQAEGALSNEEYQYPLFGFFCEHCYESGMTQLDFRGPATGFRFPS